MTLEEIKDAIYEIYGDDYIEIRKVLFYIVAYLAQHESPTHESIIAAMSEDTPGND